MNLGAFYDKEIYFYSWWIILATKLDIHGIMELAEDIATYTKRLLCPNTLILLLLLWYLS